MALHRGASSAKLLCNLRNFTKIPSFLGSRLVSDTSKAVEASASEVTGDHVLYTPEHFAMKESLRKVRTADVNGVLVLPAKNIFGYGWILRTMVL